MSSTFLSKTEKRNSFKCLLHNNFMESQIQNRYTGHTYTSSPDLNSFYPACTLYLILSNTHSIPTVHFCHFFIKFFGCKEHFDKIYYIWFKCIIFFHLSNSNLMKPVWCNKLTKQIVPSLSLVWTHMHCPLRMQCKSSKQEQTMSSLSIFFLAWTETQYQTRVWLQLSIGKWFYELLLHFWKNTSSWRYFPPTREGVLRSQKGRWLMNTSLFFLSVPFYFQRACPGDHCSTLKDVRLMYLTIFNTCIYLLIFPCWKSIFVLYKVESVCTPMVPTTLYVVYKILLCVLSSHQNYNNTRPVEHILVFWSLSTSKKVHPF